MARLSRLAKFLDSARPAVGEARALCSCSAIFPFQFSGVLTLSSARSISLIDHLAIAPERDEQPGFSGGFSGIFGKASRTTDIMCAYRVLQPPSNLTSRWPWNAWAIPRSRWFAHRAFDATLDPEQLAEARKWHQSFQLSSLPEGNTSYSRSSGPGGQHVNKSVPTQVILAHGREKPY